ncbi:MULTISPECIES: type II toxin-antitoxin system RelE/ParE family toxin [Nitrospirillum]|uniref:Toxin n=1 Tax=Nitrospirillum amazonense TaxID=28077 RepID=A0A560GAC2_9PROT|nr:type II toxin-antitoxin system RelE/ParE family toxin [Nitrospirillum amazonense]MEC4590695.1 type II toxin-antitoxin system RelE/ParE family toxin [Nitrospirillum amazonense]TWB30873.1 toxin ParE1/3/4 [Nitrospirillum amazonense]
MTKRSYVLSHEAGLDLVEIEDYTAREWGDAQAESYIRALFLAFEKLARNPQLGRRRSDVPGPFLVYGVGRHLIVYRFQEVRDRLEILNVLHPSMDIAARMKQALNRRKQRLTKQ